MALTPEMESALAAPRVLIAGLLRIALPDRVMTLCDGSAAIVFDGETYTGEDEAFGAIAAIDPIESGLGDDAPAVSISFNPSAEAAATDIAYPGLQGSAVKMWIAVVDRTTGLVVPDPHLVFLGEVDWVSLRLGQRSRTVTMECVSALERFFDDDEGMRLSPTWHRSIWPGEAGLDFATGITSRVYWGQNPPNGPSR